MRFDIAEVVKSVGEMAAGNGREAVMSDPQAGERREWMEPICMLPETAARLLKEWLYPWQRTIYEQRVEIVVSWITATRWVSVEPMTVAILRSTGQRFIINGYHRLKAIEKAGVPVDWSIRFVYCDSMEEIHSHYQLFDQPKQTRSNKDTLLAAGLGPETGLGQAFLAKVEAAVAVIHYDFRTVVNRRHAAELSLVQNRHDWTHEWLDEARIAHILLQGRGREMSALERKAVLAVMLVTIRYQCKKAETYWRAVARNDGLSRLSSEGKLVRFLLDRNRSEGGETLISRKVAAYWNAYVKERTVREDPDVNVNAPILIEGCGVNYNGE